MSYREVLDVNNRWVRIHGQSRSSSTTPGHAAAMDALAEQLARSGEYDYIVIQRSWRTATGRVGTSNKRPDIIAVRKNGKVDAYEIRSDSQTTAQLDAKLTEGMQSLPESNRGLYRSYDVGEIIAE